ncbi:MAG: glycerophosphodiester phosphodiesterase family protein [Myxococcota bacterium]|nr:glycerophosphodiester phosphodiesterase family protein [Myxococcota bacterium]
MLSLLTSLVAAQEPLPEHIAATQIIAHRGGAALAPENTLAAFTKAAELGVGFELDVTLSKDGQVIVLHDDSVDRTTNGQGLAGDLSAAELAALDAGSWFAPEFAGEPVPTLDQVLDAFGGQVLIDIEIKTHPQREQLAQGVVDAVVSRGLEDQVLVTSFDPLMLEQVKLKAPAIPRGQLTGTFKGAELNPITKLVLKRMWLNGKSEPQVIAVEASRVTRRFVRKQQRHGCQVWAWTVNDPAEMQRLLELGVTGLITDHPDVGLEQL